MKKLYLILFCLAFLSGYTLQAQETDTKTKTEKTAKAKKPAIIIMIQVMQH